MTAFAVQLISRVLLPGRSARLDEPTAVVEIAAEGGGPAADFEQVCARALGRMPEPALPTMDHSDWPGDFVVERDPPGGVGRAVVGLVVVLQRWAGDAVRRGEVLSYDGDRLRLAIPWRRPEVFDWALSSALSLIEQCAAPVADPLRLHSLTESVRAGAESFRGQSFSPTTLGLVEAARRRGLPFEIEPTFVQLGWGVEAQRIDGCLTGRTSLIAGLSLRDRSKVTIGLTDAGLPTPRGHVVTDVGQAVAAAENLGWPVVVKPLTRMRAGGVTVGIGTVDALRLAFGAAARTGASAVLVEEHIPGEDHRLLVVGGRLLAAARGSAADGAVDVTTRVHPDNRRLAERASAVIGLDVAGVEFRSTDISRSWWEIGGAICGVDVPTDFGPEWSADPDRDIHGDIVEILFHARSGRIPTAAITGTNGKTTTALMLHRIWMTAGKVTGVCTTTEVRIGREVVSTDNLSGFPGARIILGDPVVEAGVFEMPRKGLIVFGHPCDRYDVAALLNVQDDHLGEFGIHTLEQMAELKAEVLQRARHAVVVNADDPLCMAMREWAGTGRHILVARDNATLAEHRNSGGEAVFMANRDGEPWIVLAAGDREKPLMPAAEIPATMRGLLRFNETNAMFAAAIAWAQGIDVTTIRRALAGFHNSVEENPGRYNFIEGFPFRLLLDYGHNTDGVREVCAVADSLAVRGRRLVCTLTVGNLDTHQFADLAPVLARSFDRFVVGCVPGAIERSGVYGGDDPIATMLSANRRHLLDSGVPDELIAVEADPAEAVRTTLAMAQPGDLVVLLAKHQHALPVIGELLGTSPSRH